MKADNQSSDKKTSVKKDWASKGRTLRTTWTTLIDNSINLRKKYRSASSSEEVAAPYASTLSGSKTLDLGCGPRPKNPFHASKLYGVDLRDDLAENVKIADLSQDNIPYPSNYFDFCTAHDFIEHIPRVSWPKGVRRDSFVELMNEIHRVLKPGGLFLQKTPCYPSKESFQNPTHVNIITEDTFPNYFCEPCNWGKDYGFIGSFKLVEQKWTSRSCITSILKSLKD